MVSGAGPRAARTGGSVGLAVARALVGRVVVDLAGSALVLRVGAGFLVSAGFFVSGFCGREKGDLSKTVITQEQFH